VARRVLGSTVDVPALRAQLEALAAAGEHAQVIATLFELLEKLTRDHSDLAARYVSMLRGMYRSKSERVSSDQLAMFLPQLPANELAPPEPPPPAPTPPAGPAEGDGRARPSGPQKPTKPRSGGRKPVPPSMRREIVKVPVPADELRCCDAEKQVIGTRVRITIEYRPGEAYAREEHAEVRACKLCEGNVTTAPTTPAPIEGARPGPGMLAQIVTSKNSDAVPLERQSKILARGGAQIAPSTLGDWYARAADSSCRCGERSATTPLLDICSAWTTPVCRCVTAATRTASSAATSGPSWAMGARSRSASTPPTGRACGRRPSWLAFADR